MPKFLLWNVGGKPLDSMVYQAVVEYGIDVVVLVEPPSGDALLLSLLAGVGGFTKADSHERFAVYTRTQSVGLTRLPLPVPNSRMDFWRLQLKRGSEFLLVAVHGLDRVNNSEERRTLFFQNLASNVAWLEGVLGHKRTIIAGDFNANPFEPALLSAFGLHAIRVKSVGGRDHRTILGVNYDFFYNPMWSCFAGEGGRPPGTCYFNGSDVQEVFWHMIDQVVLRPAAVGYFPERRLEIVRRIGAADLLTERGLPNQSLASDHLPVRFSINLRRRALDD